MNLIPCPACNNQCSPLAPHCPECGHPFSSIKSETNDLKKWKYAALAIGAITAITFVALGAMAVYESSNRAPKASPNSPSPSPSSTVVQEEKKESDNSVATTATPETDSKALPLSLSPTPSNERENHSGDEAVIISENANLRYAATVDSGVIREVGFGERLRLKSRTPIGPWYKVFDEVTKSEGWVHGNTIKIEE